MLGDDGRIYSIVWNIHDWMSKDFADLFGDCWRLLGQRRPSHPPAKYSSAAGETEPHPTHSPRHSRDLRDPPLVTSSARPRYGDTFWDGHYEQQDSSSLPIFPLVYLLLSSKARCQISCNTQPSHDLGLADLSTSISIMTSANNGFHNTEAAKVWEAVPQAPPDAIFQLTASYKADTFEQKVNLGVGAYRDDNGKPFVLPSVKAAKKALLSDESLDHEYLSITGLNDFTESAAKLILGKDSPAIADGRVSSVQTISGTGANHLGAVFLQKFYKFPGITGAKEIYLSNPTWANHKAIFQSQGITPVDYPYVSCQSPLPQFATLC